MKNSRLAILLPFVEIAALMLFFSWAQRALYNTPFGEWQRQVLGHSYNAQLLWIVVPVLWLLLTRRSLPVYGITLRRWKLDLHDAMNVFFIAAMAGAVLGFVPYTRWEGALVMAAVYLLALWLAAKRLTGKPDPKSGVITVVLAVVMFAAIGVVRGALPAWEKALGSVLFYAMVGLGEEIWFRGFVLTRLNETAGCPNRFFGVNWGWGTLLAALLFGASHLFNGLDPVTGAFNPPWAWGAWTVFSALFFSYIRLKTGSILPGAIVHGLPQMIVYAFVSSW